MGGSILPVGMVWNYIGGIGIELNRCLHIVVLVQLPKVKYSVTKLSFSNPPKSVDFDKQSLVAPAQKNID
jgi:hypothetical protein